MPTPTAIKIVNEALIESGLEAHFDVKLKSLLMLIVDASMRRSYVQGFEDAKEGRDPKITKEKLLNFAKLFKKAKEET